MSSPRDRIKIKSFELGFSACGFAKADELTEVKDTFLNYLATGRNAELHYLEKNPERRLDPRLVLEGTRTVISLLMNYYPKDLLPEDNNFIISKYGYGKDYHFLMMEKMKELVVLMKNELGASFAKPFVDSAPVMEKAWAQRCGVGWIGKNTVLINPKTGSFHFIGVILTDLETEYDQPGTDHCGTCDKCMKACPTGALTAPHTLDPRLCIAYQTLDNKGELPHELRDSFRDRIYGCDICQDVCPFNSKAVPTSEPEFSPHPQLFRMKEDDWKKLDKETFVKLFGGTPVSHVGYERLMRNIRFLDEGDE
jgi:epoxyqueuosine reductase